jgi:hypothetical protein
MGLEANCIVRHRGKKSRGKARLEQKDLQFRGDFRLNIPLDAIKSAEAKRGLLTVKSPAGAAVFELGPQAEKWALKIRYPKSLIDKLGIKPGMRAFIAGAHAGVGDVSFWRDLEARADKPAPLPTKTAADADVVFFFCDRADQLIQMASLEAHIKQEGAIWAVYPKAQQIIRESDVMSAAKKYNLVDVKNCSFSETHSALKLVIPVARRSEQ